MNSRRRGYRSRLRLYLPLLAFALSLGACAYSVVSGDHINADQADKVEAGIQEMRELKFKRPVPMVVKTRSEAEQMMAADLSRDYTDEQFEVDGIAGALVGLYPVGINLKAESLKLLRNQVAGFYDPHGKEMVLVEGADSAGFYEGTLQFLVQRDIIGEMLLAHELTHALQDQNFGLEGMLDKYKNDDDRELALKSVAEGDATIAGYAYVMGRMDTAVADSLVEHLKDLPQMFAAEAGDAPEGLAAPLVFQYAEGVRFVAEAYKRGGWAAVDKLYKNPPQSSHQIIHPAYYFDRPAPPVKIELGGYQKIMAGWTRADQDTYGELLLRVILERNLGRHATDTAVAAQWAGDQMIILREGRSVSVFWMIAFDDPYNASHFAVVYETILDRLLGDATAHRIDYRGNNVLVVIGEGANYFNALEPEIWKETKFNGINAAANLQSADADSP
jgi:hypothetical protein